MAGGSNELRLDELELDLGDEKGGGAEGLELLDEDLEFGDPRSLNSNLEEGESGPILKDFSCGSIVRSLRSGGRLAKIVFACVAAFVVVLALTGIAAHVGAKTKDDNGRTTDGTFASQVMSKMNLSVDPCEDFYLYSCGGWISNTIIPDAYPIWDTFDLINEGNEEKLKVILEDNWPMIGTLYESCMDVANINKRGITPLQDTLLTPISRISTTQDLSNVVALLHRYGIGVFFDIFVDADFINPTRNLLQVDQGGITLPSSDYYLNPSNDTNFFKLQKDLRKHFETLLKLAHGDGADYSSKAQTCYDIEDSLGRASRPPVARRDPSSLYHPKTLKDVSNLTPSFNWNQYWQSVGLQDTSQSFVVNVVELGFLKGLQNILATRSLDDLKNYLECRTLHSTASLLSDSFTAESFSWRQKVLGLKEDLPRWKTCERRTEGALGELLGRYFVLKHFNEKSKEYAYDLTQGIEYAFASHLPEVDWMDETTRLAALKKMHAIINKIGYPNTWTDFSSLFIQSNKFFENILNSNGFQFNKSMKEVGKEVDRWKWLMLPQEVNAYYNPTTNEIAFPAGILQSPFFSPMAPDAANFGAIGAVIGHELTHGFDDEGRQFDENGKLVQWWTQVSVDNFLERISCFSNLYSSYTIDIPDSSSSLRVNGNLTLGENLADCGGVKLAWRAFQNFTKESEKELDPKEPLPGFGGLNSNQLFFVNYAQVWCSEARPEYLRQMVTTNPHSPGMFRVQGPLSQFSEFAETFQCKVGAKMNPEKRCDPVW